MLIGLRKRQYIGTSWSKGYIDSEWCLKHFVPHHLIMITLVLTPKILLLKLVLKESIIGYLDYLFTMVIFKCFKTFIFLKFLILVDVECLVAFCK